MSHITIANCYEVLGIKSDATIKDINTAYKKLALKHHPDKTGGDESSHIEFQKIQQAVEILRDPSRRKKHDLELVKLGKISVHRTSAGSSHWSATGFKRYDENSRYMYSYEQSVHVSPQNQGSKEDMQWVDQMLKAEKDFRKELARQREMDQMRAQAAAEMAGQEENSKLHQGASEHHPSDPFEQDAHSGDVLEEDPDYWDFYTENNSRKEQDIWDKCAQRAPQSGDYREEEYYEEDYEEAEEQEEFYEEFEDQEMYDDEEQQDTYGEEVEDQPEFYEGADYEEEVYEEDEEQQEFYEEEDDYDEYSLCPDDQLSEYIPSACESDLDYATARSSGSEFKSRFHNESIHAACADLYDNKSTSQDEAQKADDDTATFYDFSEAGSSHKFCNTRTHLSEAASESEQQSENLDNNDSVHRSTLHNGLSPFATPFVPYFQKKLNDPSGRYTEEDLRVELQGIVMETFCGWLETIRLTVPHAEIPRTGNDPQHCRHLGYWIKHFERPECEVCHRWMPIYTLMCPGCGIQACVGCKFHYEEE
ncbi:hypothetical protein CFD26_101700 [Aspergillus turcosus]|uniref:J domain-containing protein n=1 Tax=Aspergillus turcosus TaxID=1245748 RepID=A0A421D3H4_9EURO|nr:hypothetical protein CFD26_101700 [Aspergillus turcosus]